MNWFLIALIPPLLLALSNHVDKYLLSAHLDNLPIPVLVILSTFIGFLFLPLVFIFDIPIFSISATAIAVLVIAGLLDALALFPYFYALKAGEPSLIVPVLQLIPVFSYFLGSIFLGETLTSYQLSGMLLIISGSVGTSLDLKKGALRMFRPKMLRQMLLASLLFAIASILFKSVAQHPNFAVLIFWDYAGASLFGTLLLANRSFRHQSQYAIVNNSKQILVLNFLNEFITVTAGIVSRYALLLVAVALAQTVSGFQPVFVFLISLALSYFFPKILLEDFSRNVLIQKITCISIILIGSILIL